MDQGSGAAFTRQEESIAHLQTNEESPSCPVAVRSYEARSTVRYLGIEVDDALEMAEQTEV